MEYKDHFFKFSSQDVYNTFRDVFESSYDSVVEIGFIDNVDGYHINVRMSKDKVLVPEAEQYVINKPDYPKNIWLGDYVKPYLIKEEENV